MIQNIKALEQYLLQNNMKNTLQTLRTQLLCRIPNKPSKQFLSLFQYQILDKQRLLNEQITARNSIKRQRPQNRQKSCFLSSNNSNKAFIKKSKKKIQYLQLPIQGLMGKIAYSSIILEDNIMAQKINKVKQNKIFKGMFNKMLKDKNKNLQNLIDLNNSSYNNQVHDQLDMIGRILNQQTKLGQQDYFISQNQQESLINSSNPHQVSSIMQNQNFINQQQSILSQNSQILSEFNKINFQQEYQDDRDFGYHQQIFDENTLMQGCQQLSKKYGYPQCAVKKQKKSTKQSSKQQYKKFRDSISMAQKKKFPKGMIFPYQKDQNYPLQFNGISYDIMKIQIIYDRQKIGYEAVKDLDLKKGDLIAGRYQVQKILGNGVFAKVIKAKDLSSQNQQMTCFKMIQNDKDFIDQALDQLKLLRYLKANCNPHQHYLLNFKQGFYHREHLFIQTDLLKENLLTAFQTNPSFFSVSIIKKISYQILRALQMLHSLNIIHADLKPENIMIKSYNPIEIRVIDLGNGTFTHDLNLSSYVQSRSYRAPQVVLGCGFNQKIDIWSLGCIIAQLWTKNVLFYNYHIQGMLARIQGIVGPWPEWMLLHGDNVPNLFSNQNFIYAHDKQKQNYHIYIPKKTNLKNRIRSEDQMFVDFIKMLIQIDPLIRVSAIQALQHSFFKN